MKRIAVIAAHPDDEALGCGGILHKYKNSGAEIYLLFLADGISSRKNTNCHEHISRSHGVELAMNELKPQAYKLLNFPDNKLDSVPLLDVVQEIEIFINEVQPDVLFTHFSNDLNIDHALACRAVMTASRPGSKSFVKKIVSFEVPSSTEWAVGNDFFRPDSYVDITHFMDNKIDYLKAYQGEIRSAPHPRSFENVRALNQLRGAQVSLAYAEAFMTLRNVTDVF